MNRAEKIAFSRKAFTPERKNTRVISGDTIKKVRAVKVQPGRNMPILGSGAIISFFTDHGLIEES